MAAAQSVRACERGRRFPSQTFEMSTDRLASGRLADMRGTCNMQAYGTATYLNRRTLMKKKLALVSLLALLTISASAQNKKYETQIDPVKKEGTINLDQTGTWKAGVSEGPKMPEAAKTEESRRQEQVEKSGQVFIRKTF